MGLYTITKNASRKVSRGLLFLILLMISSCSESNLHNSLSIKVLNAINHSESIPGLKAEEFNALKADLLKTWITLIRKGRLELKGTDKEIRPSFVALQGVVEYVLSCELQKEIKSLIGVIHTPMPATPLCTQGEISKYLVSPSIENDPQRLFTVKARTTIVRDYLHQGSTLYIVYPKEGISKRTEIQQTIYKQELMNYPNNLFDRPLNASLPEELIGATYVFTDQMGNLYAFAIKMSQANDPKEIGNFGLWFGPIQNAHVKQRVSAVFHFLQENGILIFDELHNPF